MRATNQESTDATAEAVASASSESRVPASTAPTGGRGKHGWGWTLLATVLIVIGSLLAPVAVVSTWAQRELTSTDDFVDTFGPLVDDPSVRAFITQQAVSAIDDRVDIDAMTTRAVDGIARLGLGPAAATALKALAAPAAQGIKELIRNTVSRFVASESFANLWQQMLRTAHRQLGKTLSGDTNAIITLSADGSVRLQLGPILAAVKNELVAQGITFAKAVPAISKTIVIAHTGSAALIRTLYGLTLALGTWLPWVVLVLLAAGVVVARRRSVALIWAAIGLGLAMTAMAAGISVGATVFVASVSGTVPAGAARTIYTDVLHVVQSMAVAAAVLAITVAVVGSLAGPFRLSGRLRAFTASGFDRTRMLADRYGLSTGPVGRWLYRQRVLLRVAVAVVAAAIVVFVRPLGPAVIVWTAVLAIVVIGILELLQRPDAGTRKADEPAPSTLA